MSLKGPLIHRTLVEKNDCTIQLTLPPDRIRAVDLGSYLPADYNRDHGELLIKIEPYKRQDSIPDGDLALKLVEIGNSRGVSIPAPIRHRHKLDAGDVIFGDVEGELFRINF